MTQILPVGIRTGLALLQGKPNVEIVGTPRFLSAFNSWAIDLSLTVSSHSKYVPKESDWVLLVSDRYPAGDIRLFPALLNGIVHTFPHQDRNVESLQRNQQWRSGKPCLDSVFRRSNRVVDGPEPKTDPEARLHWHVERCLHWLDLAAQNQLMDHQEPFEIPQCPIELLRSRYLVVHDEGADALPSWQKYIGQFGIVKWGSIPGHARALLAQEFLDRTGGAIRECRRKSKRRRVPGFWWLWPSPVVIPPWHAPDSWEELRAIGISQGVDVDDFVEWISRRVTGKTNAVVLIGYPIPRHWHGAPTEIHWQAVLSPTVPGRLRPLQGSRQRQEKLRQRARHAIFNDGKKLEYLRTQNWHPDRLQARGRLGSTLLGRSIALVGAGALGSVVAELLVRGGIDDLTIIDFDRLEIGNLVRHTLTLKELGSHKASAVAERLALAAPMANVSALDKPLPKGEALERCLDRFDIVIDCTADDEVIRQLGDVWWSVPKLFLSASLGYRAQHLFLYRIEACSFPVEDFYDDIEPWLKSEVGQWASDGETLEGAGCWSPVFPASSVDVWLAAATTVKHLDRSLDSNQRTGLSVFEQSSGDDVGFRLMKTGCRVKNES